MKKVLSIALALLMVCVMLPMVALAAETTAVAKLTIGETVTYYDTLVEAVAAAINKQGAKIDVLKNCNGSGVEIKEKKGEKLDLTIDFHGFTYTMDGTAVGSTGYETQAWHIEKGSKLTLANGKLEASSTLGAWLLFQNYCDLTLDNMELNTQKANCDYVVSNNFGSLTVKGNSKIIAANGKIAFDIWYGMNNQALYDDGIKVSFENFTGTVEGDIEYGAANRAKDFENWQDKASLSIDGGTFIGAIKKGNANDGLAMENANISITGGTFSSNVIAYTPADKLVVTDDTNYYVGETARATVENATGGTFTVINGTNVNLTVKGGVTIVNGTGPEITVNGEVLREGGSITVPSTITIIVPSEGGTTATTPAADDQKNPATGANDFVGVAAAAAVMALLGSAVVLRKK